MFVKFNKSSVLIFVLSKYFAVGFFVCFFHNRINKKFNLYFLFLILDAKISKKVSQSAALNVIKTHKNFVGNTQSSDSSSPKPIATISNSASCNTKEKTKQLIADGGNAKDRSQILNTTTKLDCVAESSDARPKYRYCNAFPGRPQLQKFSSQLSRDVEYESKIEKFKALHEDPQLNLRDLRELSWSGIPKKMRAITWRLLSGYLPASLERRNSILEHKRLNYLNLVEQYFRVESRDETQEETFRQIHIDMPRMNPHIQLFQQTLVQEMFERILFIWAIRHPASGYVQGINDLVTPFFIVFLQEALESADLSK